MRHDRTIIMLSTADWKAPYLTNKQHMAKHLAARGFDVLYVESVGIRTPSLNTRDAKRIFQRVKRFLRGIEIVSPRISVLSCFAIPFGRKFKVINIINQSIMRWQISAYLKKYKPISVAIWAYHPYFKAGEILRQYEGTVIYHCVDDLTAVPGVDVRTFEKAEIKLATQADYIFVTSLKLSEKLLTHSSRVYYLPNVVDFQHFSASYLNPEEPADIKYLSRPRIGYVGALSDFKVNFDLILGIARARPDWNWVIIGDEREGQKNSTVEELRNLKNVFFLGYKDYSAVPAYLRAIDVAVLPSLINDYTTSMFPMKYFEYIASGCRVVSTELPALSNIQNAATEKATTITQFVEAIERSLVRGRLSVEESNEIVAGNTWESRLDKMFGIMGWN